MSDKSFVEKIEVASPCSESWDEMSGTDTVRFCSHCEKNVNNISQMTPRRAAKLVRRSGGKLCVRYAKDPDTGLPVFAQTFGRLARQSGIPAGVIGATLALSGGAFAQGGVEPSAATVSDRAISPDSASAKLSGVVTDPNGAVIPFALVSITNKETSEYRTANSSADGVYEFTDLRGGTYTLKIEAGGFEPKELDVYLADGALATRDSQLDLPKMAEVVEVRAGLSTVEQFVSGGAIITTHYETRNLLVQAVMNEDLEEVKARVAMRAKVNARDKAFDGISPLHAAVETGNVEIARFLLERGAKVNIRDYEKRTPLMMLDEDASAEMFQLLVSHGAKVNLVDKEKNTVLHHFAAYDGQVDILRLLVNYGVNVNAVNREGKTALMVAAANESTSNVEALLQSGADISLADGEGKTAWMQTDDAATRNLLETFGAVGGR